jgi:hypothetical protein
MPTPFLTMTKKRILKQNHQLQIFLHSGERENPTSSAVPPPPQVAHFFSAIARMSIESNILCSSTTSCLSCLPSWPECQIKMSVGVTIDKSHKTKKEKKTYMNRKHFCLQETQKTQCYSLLEQQTHEGNTQL